jgi:SAM-dependent MidA family methyltransferase
MSVFLDVFRQEPGAATPGVSFARFMELAMYHPEAGYYTAKRRRVGKDRGADFYTATSFNPVFGELVVASTVSLLSPHDPAEFEFVEIGAEPGGGALKDVAHPFRAYRTISYGQPLEMTGRCIVFSNELFDAQPCHRIVWRNGAWRELGVALRGDELVEVELPGLSSEIVGERHRLPPSAAEGYQIDLPLRTVPLLQRIVRQPWTGLFIAFDYGRTWQQLVEDFPEGTARTYSRQRMGGKLLARPGEQDLTLHICWDWLEDVLQQEGFGEAVVESQEAFFTRRASPVMAAIVQTDAGRFTSRKQALKHLLHPGNMGQKFQVLHALR